MNSIITNEYSNFKKELDCSLGSVLAAGVLALGSEGWVGEYLITNFPPAETIGQMTSTSPFPNIKLIAYNIPASGNLFNVGYTALSGSSNGVFINNSSINGQTVFKDYTDVHDYIGLRKGISDKWFLTEQIVAI